MRLLGEQKPLRVLVLEALRSEILMGSFEPGARLVEDQLAKELGVSRNPVREALRSLESEGLVAMSPRRGAVVARVTAEDALQMFQVRALLEAFACRIAAMNASETDIAALRKMHDGSAYALGTADPFEIGRHNTDFHTAICRMTKNTYLVELERSIATRMEWIFRQDAVRRGPNSHDEHGAILDAIAGRDPERAAKLGEEHVDTARDSYLASIHAKDANGTGDHSSSPDDSLV